MAMERRRTATVRDLAGGEGALLVCRLLRGGEEGGRVRFLAMGGGG